MMYCRRVVPRDIGELLAHAAAFHAESPLHSPYPFDRTRVEGLIRGAMASPDFLACVVTEPEGGIVGMGLFVIAPMFFSPAKEVNDLTFYVMPDWRGGRAALSLIRFMENWAFAKNASVIRLGLQTGIDHIRSASFLAKLGYMPTGSALSKSVN